MNPNSTATLRFRVKPGKRKNTVALKLACCFVFAIAFNQLGSEHRFAMGTTTTAKPASDQAERSWRTWHVSRSANASDENPGTRARPLRSISEAINRLVAGDRVIVHDGDYRDEDAGWGPGVFALQDLPVSSTVSRYTTIMAAANARPIVGKFLVERSFKIIVEGFDIRGLRFSEITPFPLMPTINRDEYDPNRPDFTQPYETRKEQIEREFASYFTLLDELNFSSGIEIVSSENIIVRNNEIIGFWAGINCRDAGRIFIRSNIIRETVNGIYAWEPAPGLSDSFIFLNLITQSLDQGISIRRGSQHVRIFCNVVLYSGRNHISLQDNASDSSINLNVCNFGGFYSETMEFPGSSGISIHSSREGNQATGNIVSNQMDLTGIDGNGLILDLMEDGSSVRVVRNVFTNNTGAGVNTTVSPNAIIRGNFLIGNRHGIKLSRLEDRNQTIMENTFWNNAEAGIKTFRIIHEQKQINRNFYFEANGLIWDDDDPSLRRYRSLEEVQSNTGWEQDGTELPGKR